MKKIVLPLLVFTLHLQKGGGRQVRWLIVGLKCCGHKICSEPADCRSYKVLLLYRLILNVTPFPLTASDVSRGTGTSPECFSSVSVLNCLVQLTKVSNFFKLAAWENKHYWNISNVAYLHRVCQSSLRPHVIFTVQRNSSQYVRWKQSIWCMLITTSIQMFSFVCMCVHVCWGINKEYKYSTGHLRQLMRMKDQTGNW